MSVTYCPEIAQKWFANKMPALTVALPILGPQIFILWPLLMMRLECTMGQRYASVYLPFGY
jgi:hypothetical protein